MTTREEILGRYRDDREAKKYGYYDYELWLEERLIEAHIELSKLHQSTVSVSVCDCRHIFLQHDSQWQKCTKCGMIAPLQTGR